jgi:hypothetical protein
MSEVPAVIPSDVWSVILSFLPNSALRTVSRASKNLLAICLKSLARREKDFQFCPKVKTVWEHNHIATPQRLVDVFFGRFGVPYLVAYDGIKYYHLARFDKSQSRILSLSAPFLHYGSACSRSDGSLLIIINSVVFHYNFQGKPLAKLFTLPFKKLGQMSIDRKGNIVVLNKDKKTFCTFDLSGKLLSEIGKVPALVTYYVIAIDNRIWVLDGQRGKLLAFSPGDSNVQEIKTDDAVIDKYAHMLGRSDLIYVLSERKVWQFDPNGQCKDVVGTYPSAGMGTYYISPTGTLYHLSSVTFSVFDFIQEKQKV